MIFIGRNQVQARYHQQARKRPEIKARCGNGNPEVNLQEVRQNSRQQRHDQNLVTVRFFHIFWAIEDEGVYDQIEDHSGDAAARHADAQEVEPFECYQANRADNGPADPESYK